MCITNSVGEGGANDRADSKMVQALLNENLGRLIPFAPLLVDGDPGTKTRDMIGEFQSRVLNMASPTRKVDPGSPTLIQLRAGMSAGLTMDKLLAIMTTASQAQAGRYLQPLISRMAANQIDSDRKSTRLNSSHRH